MPERFYRSFELDRAKANSEKRTIPVAFSSEYPVKRSDDELGDFDEILDHDPDNVDLSRLNDGAPVLDMHDMDRQVGVVEEAKIDDDRKGRAVLRFGKGPLAEQIFQDIKDGIRKHVSVGYELTKVLSRSKGDDGRQSIRFAWMPYEISSVSAPEDPNTGVGRGKRGYDQWNRCLQECINALTAALEKCTAMSDGTRASAQVAIAACQAALDNLGPAAAQVCMDECYEFAYSGRSCSCPECQAAVIAAVSAGECCYQVLLTKSRSVDSQTLSKRNKFKNTMPTETKPSPQTDETKVVEIGNRARDEERKRMKDITSMAESMANSFPEGAERIRALANEAIEEGKSAADFNAELLPVLPGVRKQNPITCRSLGMNEKEVESYSLSRAIQSMIRNKGRIDGLEGEAHQAMLQRNIGIEPDGLWVPPDALLPVRVRGRQKRDLNVTTFGQGGAFVATTLMTPIIEIFRNRMVCNRLGTQSLAGLEGNVAIPRQTGAATAYALPESATLTKSTQALDQILLTPHRVGAWNDYTKQLLLQSSVDVENFIRDDLMKVLAIKWDYLILQGSGQNSEPTGIMNTTGIGSVTFGGAVTWANVIQFETDLALANADAGVMAYVTTPAVRGKWKAVAKIGTTFPIFIWEKGDWGEDSNDGEVNGYRAAATNQILGNQVAFGHWADVIGPALWGGYDVVVNPYSRDTDGVVRVTINTFGDIAVRHAASFAWSSDAGNQ